MVTRQADGGRTGQVWTGQVWTGQVWTGQVWTEAVTSDSAVLCPLATGDALVTATGPAVPAVMAQAAALLADPQCLPQRGIDGPPLYQ